MKGFTHSGTFHADDVFSTALLRLIYPDFEVTRGYSVPDGFDGIVYDIGMGEFDHHQAGVRKRPDGRSYAAFGLLWEKYGPQLVGEKEAKEFDEHFVAALDDADNGGTPCVLSAAVSWFNPEWDSADSPDERFAQAVDFAEGILRRYLSQMKAQERAEVIVRKALEESDDHVVVLPKFVPWQSVLVDTDKTYCVFPDGRGGWGGQGVPVAPQSFKTKIPFPEEWAGADIETLHKIDPNLNFCHKARFYLSASDAETAARMCRLSEEIYRCGKKKDGACT